MSVAAILRRRGEYRLPEMIRAYTRWAVRQGLIEKPDACARCGEAKRLEGHHESYARPLDVVFLCRQCHRARHSEMFRAGLNARDGVDVQRSYRWLSKRRRCRRCWGNHATGGINACHEPIRPMPLVLLKGDR